jgi:hypothetical protein
MCSRNAPGFVSLVGWSVWFFRMNFRPTNQIDAIDQMDQLSLDTRKGRPSLNIDGEEEIAEGLMGARSWRWTRLTRKSKMSNSLHLCGEKKLTAYFICWREEEREA